MLRTPPSALQRVSQVAEGDASSGPVVASGPVERCVVLWATALRPTVGIRWTSIANRFPYREGHISKRGSEQFVPPPMGRSLLFQGSA